MNQFQFTITDNTQSPAVVTVIDEPVGWDGLEFKLARHNDWHGFFDYFDKDISMLEFDGVGFGILKDAYELVGVEAEVTLLIEFRCSETDSFEEIYEGNFDFLTYEQTCGDRCFIKINVNTTSCLVQFKNRYDQKVNIESLRTFDLPDGDPDDLSAYAGIGFEMLLEPNEVFLRTFYQITDPSTFNFTDTGGAIVGEVFNHYYTFYLDISTENTLPTFGAITNNTDVNTAIIGGAFEYFLENGFPYFELTELSKLACYGDFYINIHVKGEFTEDTNSDRQYASGFALVKVESDGTVTVLDNQTIHVLANYNGNVPNTETFDLTFTETTTLSEGDKLFFYLGLFNYQYLTGPVDPFTLEVTFETFDFDISGLTQCEATNSKVSLINETASRVTEIITGDCLRVYSDLYGRTDAEPYVSADDGCGSLRVLANGLFIRRALNVDDSEPQHTLSMKDMFEALSAIDCIGMGVELDPNRAGYEMLRIEGFQHFYDNTVLLTLTGVAKTERTVHMEGIFSTFKSGYGKYETETVGGRNEIHTKRNFRTTLKTIQKELVKICPFIASGHSIEITRWQVGNTSQDYRYDTDTFIICVNRNVYYENGWQVARGTDQTAVNLPNYDTVYNVQISPQRNARRWTPIVFQCYVDFANGVMKFMDGDGNLIAETFIYAEPSANDCGVELIDIGSQPNTPENSDIDYTKFNSTNKSDFYPIFKPERVSFQYPLSYTDWKIVKAAPTGLIGFECNGTTEYGWIDELNYRPVEGMADFVLIPQQPDIIEEG